MISRTLAALPHHVGCLVALACLLGAVSPAQGKDVRASAPSATTALALALPEGWSEDDVRAISNELDALSSKIEKLRGAGPMTSASPWNDLLADVEIYARSVSRALKYEEKLDPQLIPMIRRTLRQGHIRADQLLGKSAPWTKEKGRLLRGFRSTVDGSTQPYGVVVPTRYDGTKPMRLDVVLHGSLSRWKGSAEIRFQTWFRPNEAGGVTTDDDFIEIYPLGRVENGYRWAGETDIFEALDAVCRNYRIDRDRIVLRGFSMGASGAWHVGLKHPDRFVALGPYSGYVDTHRFSKEFADRGFEVGPLPPHQEKPLSLFDAVRYAANAGLVPAIAANGAEDGSAMRNHLNMAGAMAAESQQMINLVSPGTGHLVDPVTRKRQLELIQLYADRDIDRAPRDVRFVTWSLRYNRYHWLELLKLDEHYARTEVVASAAVEGSVNVAMVTNVREFAIHPPMLQASRATLEIDGVAVAVPPHPGGKRDAVVFARGNDGWAYAGRRETFTLTGKRPGLQGPIDDAFTNAFLCVNGTGQPWNASVGAWADASLRRFAYEWERYMGGRLPVKDDTQVTPEDLRTKHLILFGDPGSNPWIAQALPSLPVTWTRTIVQFDDESYPAAEHAPVLICENPLPEAAGRYLVINSGHTFHEKEFTSPNYLLFARLGDWALMHIEPGAADWQPSGGSFPESTIQAGLFDENWQVPKVKPNGPKPPSRASNPN